MEELTLIELHLGGITFGNDGDDGHLDTSSIIGSDEESETTSAEIETGEAKRSMGRRIGRALAVTVLVSLIARAVVGRVRGSDTEEAIESTDDPEVVSVDTAVAEEN
jgi:hypothetical protein